MKSETSSMYVKGCSISWKSWEYENECIHCELAGRISKLLSTHTHSIFSHKHPNLYTASKHDRYVLINMHKLAAGAAPLLVSRLK